MGRTVFLSAVTNEYARLRAMLADFLRRSCSAYVHHQSDFVESDEYTLMKLKSHIEESDAVIHLIGLEFGWVPPKNQIDEVIEYFKANTEYGDIEIQYPDVTELARNGKLSATQFEAWLAVHILKAKNKKPLCFNTLESKLAETNQSELSCDQKAQIRHLEMIRKHDVYATSAGDDFALYHEILLGIQKLGWLSKEQVENELHKPNNLPLISLGNLFKGRDDFLERIAAGLKKGATAITAGNVEQVKQSQPAAIHGSGGIGKTRAAIEYAWRNQDHYSALLFIPADSPEQFTTSLALLYGVLEIEELEESNDEDRLAAVLKWLNTHSDWLAIIDNVDSFEVIEAVKTSLKDLTKGHVLITSRITSWPAAVEPLSLDVLPLGTAAEYLLESAHQRQKADDDRIQAEAVAEKVGRIPLGLEHAKAYINRLGIRFEDYLTTWENDEADILTSFKELKEIDYPHPLLVTWKLSADQLNEDARKLLELFAWFAPEPIPEGLLENLPEDFLSNSSQNALADLVEFSLATRVLGTSFRSFILHRLVQATTRFHFLANTAPNEHGYTHPLEIAAQVLQQSFFADPTNYNNWTELEPLIEHVQSACNFVLKYELKFAFSAVSFLLNSAGYMYLEKGKYGLAESNLSRALRIVDEDCANELTAASIAVNLSMVLHRTHQLEKAEVLVLRAIKILENLLNQHHASLANAYGNYADILHDKNQLPEAINVMRRAIAIDKEFLSEHLNGYAKRLSNLADILIDSHFDDKNEGSVEFMVEAEELMRQALDIHTNIHGREHPTTAIDLSKLALLLRDTSKDSDIVRLDEAESNIKEALVITERTYGENHPNYGDYLNTFALILRDKKQLKQALPLMRRSTEITESVFGISHPKVANRNSNLAMLLFETGNRDESIQLMQKAIKSTFLSKGPAHPSFLTYKQNYEFILKKMGLSTDEIARVIELAISE